MKMEQTDCSETSAYKIQTPGNQKKTYNIQNTAKDWNQVYHTCLYNLLPEDEPSSVSKHVQDNN
jgi:hypothetical protein